MKTRQIPILSLMVLVFLILPFTLWAQEEEDLFALDDVEIETEEQPEVKNEVGVGIYYQDDPSYAFGKYSGLTDDSVEPLIDFRLEKRPAWDGDNLNRWRFQGWRVGLDSRRLEFDFRQQGKQHLNIQYRQFPNNRFSNGQTPYLGIGSDTLHLPDAWQVEEESSNTRGFLSLDETLHDLKIDTERRRMDLSWDRKLGKQWQLAFDYRHETRGGERTIGSIFGYTGGNPRSVILPAPVDHKTDIIEAMFQYATTRAQFGFGVYASFFKNDDPTLTWQNAYGHLSQWAAGVQYPDSQGRLALEPDNSYVQFKAYGGISLSSSTQLNADFSYGEMKQDDPLLPYTVNPSLEVDIPVPLDVLDAKIDTTMINLRLTSRLARRFNLTAGYHYDDRDNKTPRAVYPYIGGDSQNQRSIEDGRINLPYSYTEHKADLVLNYRLARGTRLKGGVAWSDYSRDYSEVSNSDEISYLAGIRFNSWEKGSLSLDYKYSDRDVSEYIGNTPFLESHLPGTHDEDEWENHPLLRKYFLTDRKRDEFRFRADFFPDARFNLGLSATRFEDDYDDGFFGLNDAEITSWSLDGGFYPSEKISLTGFYTREKYNAEQSNRSFRGFAPQEAFDPDRDWFVDTEDDVDTYNLSLAFKGVGAGESFDFGFDYTYSNTDSVIDVTATTLETAPLPRLKTKWRSFSAWGRFIINERSSIYLSAENGKLDSDDFALDNVVPDTLANVLTLGESAPNYDVILVSASWRYHF